MNDLERNVGAAVLSPQRENAKPASAKGPSAPALLRRACDDRDSLPNPDGPGHTQRGGGAPSAESRLRSLHGWATPVQTRRLSRVRPQGSPRLSFAHDAQGAGPSRRLLPLEATYFTRRCHR